jgi:hypothetical protein
MTNMGSFDATDNGGSFNFNGSTNFGSLTVANTTLTQATFIAVVKSNGIGGWAEILGFGTGSSLFIGTEANKLKFYSPSTDSGFTLTSGVWYSLVFTLSSSGTINFYVNDSFISTITVSPQTRTET